MNHSDGPHSKKNGEAKTRDSKQINHKIVPERLSEPHLSEYAERRNKQRNNDTKNITASTGFEQRLSSALNILFNKIEMEHANNNQA